MARFQVADAKVELGQCFVQFGAAISPDTDLAGLLTRHARQDYAPGMLIEEWGGRIASSWDGGAVIIIVETVTMSAEGWRDH